MIGVFAALDLAHVLRLLRGHGLIPMFLIIGIWGGKRRIQATYKFFFYTLHRLRADAARHHGDVLAGRHDSISATLLTFKFPAEDADLAVARPSSPRSR